MSLLEEFVVRIYSSKLEGVTTVNRARYEMFTYGGKDFDHLPPTKNALSFHTLRAAYIAGHVWGQALDPSPNLPSPSSWGYEMKNNTWIPKWTTLPTILNSTWSSANVKRSANHHASAHQRLCAALPCVPVVGSAMDVHATKYQRTLFELVFLYINYICTFV